MMRSRRMMTLVVRMKVIVEVVLVIGLRERMIAAVRALSHHQVLEI
jgi:hypothetical protein